jgi:hypothetical protein
VSRVGPSLLAKKLLQPSIPTFGCSRSTAPVAVRDVDDVILEIAKSCIGILGSGQILWMITEQHPGELLAGFGADVPQSVERKVMMSAATVSRPQDGQQAFHGALLEKVGIRWLGTHQRGNLDYQNILNRRKPRK